MSAWQGTTASISVRNFSRMVRFFAVVSSWSEKPSCLPPIKPMVACDQRAILPQLTWFSRVSLAVENIEHIQWRS